MAVLVTGGFGLVGSSLTRVLAERGGKVWVLNKWLNLPRLSGIEDRVKVIQGDLAAGGGAGQKA
jgi:UDP-glucose 4-epimerase